MKLSEFLKWFDGYTHAEILEAGKNQPVYRGKIEKITGIDANTYEIMPECTTVFDDSLIIGVRRA